MTEIIFKPLEICNSNCIYCDVIKKNNHSIMNYTLLEIVFKRIDEYLTKYNNEKINLTWHGGEFTLLGPNYLKKALEFQNKYCKNTASRIHHMIQSNLTKLNQEIIDNVKCLGVYHIGSSFDPIPNIRGYGQKRDSFKYDSDFFGGINLLEKNNISWSIIYVVHKQSLDSVKNIFYFLNNLMPENLAFNKIHDYDQKTKQYTITAREFSKFLGSIFPYWYKYKSLLPSVRPFDEIITCIEKRVNNNVCERSGFCSYKWAYIGPTGETSQCGRCEGDSMISYGNIKECSLEEVLSNRKRNAIQSRYNILIQNECRDCRFWGICHGGCPIDAYCENGSFLTKSSCCEWLKDFMIRYFEPITGIKAELYPDTTLDS